MLWIWHRPAAIALIRPLAWESPFVAGVALKRQKKKKKKKKKEKTNKQTNIQMGGCQEGRDK